MEMFGNVDTGHCVSGAFASLMSSQVSQKPKMRKLCLSKSDQQHRPVELLSFVNVE